MPKKKKQKQIRLEYLYDRKKNQTLIYVWSGMTILDNLLMPGTLSAYVKEKIHKEMSKKYEDD